MRERSARLQVLIAGKSSRKKSLSDKICRLLVNRMSKRAPEEDFMRDPLIDNDQGFDAEELERFQRGG
ncbi:MAG: hypothetical protein F4X99_17075 [Gammaproteobacteria bacterium]|nr:hypothetical protein [Gammaproteobacteria bacterium]